MEKREELQDIKARLRQSFSHYTFGFRGVLQNFRARKIYNETSCFFHGIIQ